MSAALLIVACDTETGGSTGSSIGGDASETDETGGTGVATGTGGTEAVGCGAEWTTVISDSQQELAWFSDTPAEIMVDISGLREGTFTWEQVDGPITTPYEGSETPVTFEVIPTGEARFIEVEFHGQYPNNDPGGFFCSHRLEIDVQLLVTSEDGVFAIDSPSIVTLEAIYGMYGMNPYLNHTIDFTTHEGQLSASDFTVGDGQLYGVYIYASGLDGVVNAGLSIAVVYDWGFLGSLLGSIKVF